MKPDTDDIMTMGITILFLPILIPLIIAVGILMAPIYLLGKIGFWIKGGHL